MLIVRKPQKESRTKTTKPLLLPLRKIQTTPSALQRGLNIFFAQQQQLFAAIQRRELASKSLPLGNFHAKRWLKD